MASESWMPFVRWCPECRHKNPWTLGDSWTCSNCNAVWQRATLDGTAQLRNLAELLRTVAGDTSALADSLDDARCHRIADLVEPHTRLAGAALENLSKAINQAVTQVERELDQN